MNNNRSPRLCEENLVSVLCPCMKSCSMCWKLFQASRAKEIPEFNPYITGQRLFFIKPPEFLFRLIPPEKIYNTDLCIHGRVL